MTLEKLLDKISNVHALRGALMRLGVKVRGEEQKECVLLMIKLADAMRGNNKNRCDNSSPVESEVWRGRLGGCLKDGRKCASTNNIPVTVHTEIAMTLSHHSTW